MGRRYPSRSDRAAPPMTSLVHGFPSDGSRRAGSVFCSSNATQCRLRFAHTNLGLRALVAFGVSGRGTLSATYGKGIGYPRDARLPRLTNAPFRDGHIPLHGHCREHAIVGLVPGGNAGGARGTRSGGWCSGGIRRWPPRQAHRRWRLCRVLVGARGSAGCRRCPTPAAQHRLGSCDRRPLGADGSYQALGDGKLHAAPARIK